MLTYNKKNTIIPYWIPDKKSRRKDEGSLLAFETIKGSVIKQLSNALDAGKWALQDNIGEKLDAHKTFAAAPKSQEKRTQDRSMP